MTIEGASHLHQALYDAIKSNDAATFNSLARQHFAEILEQFDAWTTIPAAIRADQNAASEYVQSLVDIAQAFESAGEPALMERLIGPEETNPIVRWNRRLLHAQALSEAGKYEDSNSQLIQILSEMEGATGTAVVNLRPKILGRLGYNALHERNYTAALDYNIQAHDASLDAGDEEGIVTYYENMMSLRVIQVLDADPERGQRLLDVRRLILRAQNSADAGRYLASIDLLSQALSIMQTQNEDELFRAMLPKINGLLGFNEYKLGDKVKAREHIALALNHAKTIGDVDGVRIYSANLEAINGS